MLLTNVMSSHCPENVFLSAEENCHPSPSVKYEMTKTETRDDVVKLYTSAAVMYGISSLNTFCSIVVNLYSVLQNIISDI